MYTENDMQPQTINEQKQVNWIELNGVEFDRHFIPVWKRDGSQIVCALFHISNSEL